MDLLEPLYASVLDFSALDTFNQRLAEATDSHIAGVLIHDVAAGRAGISRIHGVDAALMTTLLPELNLRDDPMMQRVTPHLGIGKVLDSEDFLPRAEFQRSDFYNGYYRRLGIVQQVASVGLFDGVNSVTLSLCHGDQKRKYGEAELGLMRALTPHWINAYAMLRRMHGLERQVETLEQALEFSPVAMFVLDEDLRIVRGNAAGEALLQGGLLRREAGVLAARGAPGLELHGLLQRALRGGSRLPGGDVERLVLRDAGEHPALALTAHRLVEWSPREQGALLVFVREVGRVPPSLKSALRALFTLTEAEARLALSLYRNADAALAARECGITPGTAQGRLKMIYDKTGERGQASLVRLVAAVAGTCGE
ncbi:helix-turn-helix transcriptional regulator [Stenotrophomonas acidaminiphila]